MTVPYRLERVGVVMRHDPALEFEADGVLNPATGRIWNVGHGTTLGPQETSSVDGITGCAMLVRREVFEAIGLFAEEYFFGLEDLDFCLRARRAGWPSACVSAAVVRRRGAVRLRPGAHHRQPGRTSPAS